MPLKQRKVLVWHFFVRCHGISSKMYGNKDISSLGGHGKLPNNLVGISVFDKILDSVVANPLPHNTHIAENGVKKRRLLIYQQINQDYVT